MFRRKNQVFWLQAAALAVWSLVCVLPLLLRVGPNIVGVTLAEGASRFWSHVLPYQAASPGADVYHYPLFFAFAYRPFLEMPPMVGAVLWAFLNCFVFWAGVSVWIRLNRSTSKWTWLAMVFLAIELDISLRYQQVNALTIGLVLLGAKQLVENRFWMGSVSFALAGHIKVIPFFVAGWLLLKKPKRAMAIFVGICLAVGLLPLLEISWSEWFEWQQALYLFVTDDMSHRGARNMLDLSSVFSRWGLAELGVGIVRLVIVATLTVSLLLHWKTADEDYPVLAWLTLFFSAFLMYLPRAESPMFILLAPGFLLLTQIRSSAIRWCLVAVFFLTSFVYTSVWRAFNLWPWANYNWNSKPLGALLLWVVAMGVLLIPVIHSRTVVWRFGTKRLVNRFSSRVLMLTKRVINCEDFLTI